MRAINLGCTVALVTRAIYKSAICIVHIYNVLQKKFKFIPLIHIYDWLIVTCWNKIIKIHKNSILFHYTAKIPIYSFIIKMEFYRVSDEV